MHRFVLGFLISLLVGGTAPSLNAQVVGQVLEESTRQPIEGVDVWIEGTRSRRVTDEEGQFQFYRLPAGSYRIVTGHWAYEPRTIDVTAAAGRLTQVPVATRLLLPLPLSEGTTIRVTLRAGPVESATGSVVGVMVDTLLIDYPGAGPSEAVPLGALRALEVRQLESRPRAGAFGGMAMGSVAGAIAGPLRGSCFAGRQCSTPGEVMVGALFGGVIGAAAGWVVGALFLERATWLNLPLPEQDR